MKSIDLFEIGDIFLNDDVIWKNLGIAYTVMSYFFLVSIKYILNNPIINNQIGITIPCLAGFFSGVLGIIAFVTRISEKVNLHHMNANP